MKDLRGFIIGVILTLLTIYTYIGDRFDLFPEELVTPVTENVRVVTEFVKPDTVYKVKIDTFLTVKTVTKVDTLLATVLDTIYLERGTTYQSDRLFTYDYATFNVTAFSRLPVDEFTATAVFNYDSYLRDNQYIKKPQKYLWLTKSEWQLLGAGILIGVGGWEVIR